MEGIHFFLKGFERDSHIFAFIDVPEVSPECPDFCLGSCCHHLTNHFAPDLSLLDIAHGADFSAVEADFGWVIHD